MKKEKDKDFNAMMNNNKNMPKFVILDDEGAKKWGGKKMIIAPPIYYDEVMKKIPNGKIITTDLIRKYIAKKNKSDITCPLTAGIFINICAWASSQRKSNITPYWRTVKSDGMLNEKYPGGAEEQKKLLQKEGHTIVTKGIKNIKYYVEDYKSALYDLK